MEGFPGAGVPLDATLGRVGRPPTVPPVEIVEPPRPSVPVDATQGRFIEFRVLGEAKPAGSKKGFYNPKAGRVIITDDSKGSRPWKDLVHGRALDAMSTASPLNGALRCSIAFFERRPKGHFNTKNELNKTGREKPYPTKKPDVLKLARAVEDAMNKVVYVDDSQIVHETISKQYADWDGVEIRVQELEL